MSMVNSKTFHWTGTVPARVQSFFTNAKTELKIAQARRAKYRKTYAELVALSDRDLADIGIARYDISRLAREESLRGTHP